MPRSETLTEKNLWMLDCEPRLVQLEALRRSFLGYALLDGRDAEPNKRMLRAPGPATGWGHFMQMRLGKTPTLLNEYLLARKWLGLKKLLVISPNTYKNTWALECEKFKMPVPVLATDGRKIPEVERFVAKNPEGILIVNYEALRFGKLYPTLQKFAGPTTVIGGDESILMKGHDSLITMGAIGLAKTCALRRPMSGKPISQGPHDIWSQLRFAGELSGILYTPFKTKFAKMGGFQGKQVVGVREEHEAELADIINSCSFKARRSDWMDHYAVDYSQVQVAMEPKQAQMYAEMDEEFVTWINEDLYVKADQIITKLMKLQQISSGFIIDEMGNPNDIVDPDRNPKAMQVAWMLENEIEGKTIVACHYSHSISILRKALAKYNPAVIQGKMKAGKGYDVDAEKDRFNNDPACRVIIGQIQATKYGHTLVGTKKQPCTTTLMYENTFSLDDRSQIEERNQGATQMGPTSVVDFMCSKNDLRPIEALIRKEDVASVLLQFRRSTGILPR